MKLLTTTLIGVMAAANAFAQFAPPLHHVIESRYQQLQPLTTMSIQQGASLSYRVSIKTDGKWWDLDGLTARWDARETATNTSAYTASSSATITNVTPNYFQIDIDNTQTGTAFTNWVYSVIVLKDGGEYPQGEGRIDVPASAWTGASGILTNATYLQTVAVDGVTITGDGTPSNPLVAASGGGATLQDVTDNGDTTTGAVRAATMQLTGGTGTQGEMTWNDDDQTVNLVLNGSIVQIGQEWGYHAVNHIGATIPDGTPVYAAGVLGASGKILIEPYIANGTIPAHLFIGVVSYDIANGGEGFVTAFGKVRGLDFLSAFSDGDLLYPSATVVGGWTNVAPASPNIALLSCFVIDAAPSGTMQVRVNNLDANEFATAAQGALADSAIQTELDPVWGAVSNTVTTGAALGATATQPADLEAYVSTDQTTPQTVSNGVPIFEDGAAFGAAGAWRVANVGGTLRIIDDINSATIAVITTNGLFQINDGNFINTVTATEFAGDTATITNKLLVGSAIDTGEALQVTGDAVVSGDIDISTTSAYQQGATDILKVAGGDDGAVLASTICGVTAGAATSAGQTKQTVYGYYAGNGNSAGYQAAVGFYAGSANSGLYQAAMGAYSGASNTEDFQTAFGYWAGRNNKGANNISFGARANYNNDGDNVTAVGVNAGRDNTGDDCVFIGYEAGRTNAAAGQFIVKQSTVNATPLIVGDFVTCDLTMPGTVTATAFVGDGSGLTCIPRLLLSSSQLAPAASGAPDTPWTNINSVIVATIQPDDGNNESMVDYPVSILATETNFTVTSYWYNDAGSGDYVWEINGNSHTTTIDSAVTTAPTVDTWTFTEAVPATGRLNIEVDYKGADAGTTAANVITTWFDIKVAP